MANLKIKIHNREFELNCSENEHEKVKQLAAEIAKQIESIYASNNNINYDLALIILLLNYQDQISSGTAGADKNDNVILKQIYSALQKI